MLRNEHHVIPRAYGGSDGPLVSLDSAHHDLLHLIADKISSRQPFKHLTTGFSKESLERLMYLATRVAVAASTMGDDPNKRVPVHFTLSKSENEQLKQLTDFHRVSRERLLRELIRRSYITAFQPTTK